MRSRNLGTLLAVVLAIVPPLAASAQEAIPSNYRFGEVSFGGLAKETDKNSSKFQEYRDLRPAFAPTFKIDGKDGDVRYSLHANDLFQQTRRYSGFVEGGHWKLEALHQGIPHRFGNDARSLNVRSAPGVFAVDDATQRSLQSSIESVPRASINYAFLNGLVGPLVNGATPFDLDFKRQRTKALLTLTPNDALSIQAGYFNELRTGFRGGAGTSFGFGNVVETPDDTDFKTQDVGANLEYAGDWGSVRAGLHYNWFRNAIPSLTFDNPFRAIDATDPSAYTAPASGSIAGPTQGRVALPPDNDAITGNAGGTLFVTEHTRAHVDVSYGQWMQDRTPFIPFSTNTAITTPVLASNLSSLPATKLDGKMDVTSLSASVSSRPRDGWSLNMRYRHYELDNKTSRFTIPGYVRFDGNWQATPRISVPYGHKTGRFDVTAAYDFGKITVEGGYKWNAIERHFRETEKTADQGLTAAIDLRPSDTLIWRTSYEFGRRDYKGLEIESSEDASFVTPGAPANIFAAPSTAVCTTNVVCNLRFDQAPRDFNRVSSLLTYTPGDKWAFTGSYIYAKSNYKNSYFGLRDGKYDSFTMETDYAATERINVFAFYSFENQKDTQWGRQSGATFSTSSLDDWASFVDDKVNSVGGGLNVVIVPDKWDLNVNGSWQDVNGNNDFSAPTGGAPANARLTTGGITDITAFDDLTLVTVGGEIKYRYDKRWAFAAGGTWEKYDVADANTDDLLYYVPGSFFLNGNNGDYKGKWGYVRLIYSW